MSKLYYGSIDVTKIDKTKLVTTNKNGEKFANGGAFLNIAVWVNDEEDQYGNSASIQQSQTQEERTAGAPKVYLGNLKEHRVASPTQSEQAQDAEVDVTGDLPF